MSRHTHILLLVVILALSACAGTDETLQTPLVTILPPDTAVPSATIPPTADMPAATVPPSVDGAAATVAPTFGALPAVMPSAVPGTVAPPSNNPDFTAINANWDLSTPKRTITTRQFIWPCEQVRTIDMPADWNYAYNMYCNISPYFYQVEYTPGNWGLHVDVSYTARPTQDNPRGQGGAIRERAGARMIIPDMTFYPDICYGARVVYYDIQLSTTDSAPLDFFVYGVINVNGQPERYVGNALMPSSIDQLTDGEQFLGSFQVDARTTADFGFQWDIIHPHVVGHFGVTALRVEKMPDTFCQ